ncbi:hypothetical protein PVAP13_5NG514400 [Panicum virgatum]|uniref:Uncharacterized protein n=1 Tax=Panicum virgatum TaxID=38727 RepID=A0A8T0S592_PANVG|nr:hypothetical protein PVAP13_5NG514400 [Panicum virgatum]KAG2591927.1 hypothetical protein PVAP13_5NG514400 [Panicum virgatum]
MTQLKKNVILFVVKLMMVVVLMRFLVFLFLLCLLKLAKEKVLVSIIFLTKMFLLMFQVRWLSSGWGKFCRSFLLSHCIDVYCFFSFFFSDVCWPAYITIEGAHLQCSHFISI